MRRDGAIALPMAVLAVAVVVMLIGMALLASGALNGNDDGGWVGPDPPAPNVEPIAYLTVSAKVRATNPVGDGTQVSIQDVYPRVDVEPRSEDDGLNILEFLGLLSDNVDAKVVFEVSRPGYGSFKQDTKTAWTVGENEHDDNIVDAPEPWVIYEEGTYNIEVRIYKGDSDTLYDSMRESVTVEDPYGR